GRAASAGARRAGGSASPLLQVAAGRLLALDGLEERLEVAVPEAARAVSLDDLEEHRGPRADRPGEDLEQVPLVVAVGQDPEVAQVVVALRDVPDPPGELLVVRAGSPQEPHPALLEGP